MHPSRPSTPTVTGVSPNQGLAAGGTQVTVSGTNFKVATINAVASVSFGTMAVTNTPCTAGSPPGNTPCFTVDSRTQLTVRSPAHSTGTVDVTVDDGHPLPFAPTSAGEVRRRCP